VDPRPTTIAELLASYDGFLLDAYGVLINSGGALPGAVALLTELNRRGTPHLLVSNDASRAPDTYVKRFAGFGLPLTADQVVTSGSLIPGYFRAHGLAGARTCVLGTADSYAYVVEGGGIPVPLAHGMEIDALAVCDNAGTPFVEGIEIGCSAVVRAVEAGRRPALILPNPDLVYPKAHGELGFTSGAMALLIETALNRRFPTADLRFVHLGKPEPHLFAEARRRLGVQRLVMIGDQLETDIAGARAAGLDSALLAGVSRWDPSAAIAPTYLLATIQP
jgi:HAD superfamily hydrolase (TIGR01450 family)